MDRIASRYQLVIWSIFGAAVAMVLVSKAIRLGWFDPRPQLKLNDQPALLFFNRDRGCECELLVYRSAEAQLAAWRQEDRFEVRIIALNLEQRRDLVRAYQVVRAPTLLLLDGSGQTVWRQDEVITDREPFDLRELERQIIALDLKTQ